MPVKAIQIKRYPNRRYYARHASKYVSLQEIEEIVRAGQTVEIRDSQTGQDLTRAVLTQIIVERQPDKMALFPIDMLHFIVRSNDAMSDFLRDYFRHSLTYLDYLQHHSATRTLTQPIHWLKAWLDGITPPETSNQPVASDEMAVDPADAPPTEDEPLSERVQRLEERLRDLESKEDLESQEKESQEEESQENGSK